MKPIKQHDEQDQPLGPCFSLAFESPEDTGGKFATSAFFFSLPEAFLPLEKRDCHLYYTGVVNIYAQFSANLPQDMLN
jgi:hypothetical protein